MTRKIYATVAPLVAIVAFVAVPGIAQANEHWYVGTIKIAESSKKGENEVTLKTSGKMTFNYGGPSVTCEVAQTSKIWNPSGKGNGLGEVTAFEVKSCTEPTGCPKISFKPESLPWSVEIYEAAKVNREATKMTLALYCGKELAFSGITGTLAPRFINASSLPPKAAEVEYEVNSGELTASGGFKLTWNGALTVEGAKEKEKIQVKE